MQTTIEVDRKAVKTDMADLRRSLSTHWDYLFAYANMRLQNEDEAKDIVQDTFLSALEKLDRFEGRCMERTWLVSILKNKIADKYRRRTVLITYDVDNIADEDETSDLCDTEAGYLTAAGTLRYRQVTHDDGVEKKEFDQFLRNYMQGLPALWSSVFMMKHLEDQPTKTICNELNVTASHCWVIMHRIKNNFRQYLEQNWN